MSKRRSSRSEPEAGPSNLNTAKRARLKSPTRVIDADADIEPLRSLIKECAVAECELEELEKRLIPRLEARRLANQGRIGVRVHQVFRLGLVPLLICHHVHYLGSCDLWDC